MDLPPKRIRAIVADDDDFARAGIRAMLERMPGVEVVGEATDGEEAVAAAIALQPDLAILDWAMGPPDGVQAAERIRHECPATRVLMLSVNEGSHYVGRARSAGAHAYVAKAAASSDLAPAVVAVSQDRAFVSAQAFDAPPVTRASRIPPWGVALCYLLISVSVLVPLYQVMTWFG